MTEQQPHRHEESEASVRARQLAKELDVGAADVARLAIGGATLMPTWAKWLWGLAVAGFLIVNGWFLVNAVQFRSIQIQHLEKAERDRDRNEAREEADDQAHWQLFDRTAARQQELLERVKRIEAKVGAAP